jgi:hypothetical protein
MVTLPKDFVATKHDGYFWNLKEQKLYSIKVGGTLRRLSGPRKPNPFNHYIEGYQVSVNGRKRIMALDTLKRLKAADSIIKVEKS